MVEGRLRALTWETAMSTENRPHEALLAALSPLLKEAAGLDEGPQPHGAGDDLLALLEENARLRKLAVKLSNLLGDLPVRAANEPPADR